MRIEDLLTLAQWLSPSYPVGGFAYSHGLETAIAEGLVGSERDLSEWLADLLDHGTGRGDAILLGAAHRAADDPAALAGVDAHALAFAQGAERRAEARRLGAAFCATTNAVWQTGLPPLAYPVAIGAAAGRRALPVEPAAALHLQALSGNLVQAALRLMPLGQTAGQRVLAGLAPRIAALLPLAQAGDLGALAGQAWGWEIAALRHETLQPRIFAT